MYYRKTFFALRDIEYVAPANAILRHARLISLNLTIIEVCILSESYQRNVVKLMLVVGVVSLVGYDSLYADVLGALVADTIHAVDVARYIILTKADL